MDSNSNKNYGEEHQQLRRSPRKRKFNEVDNDDGRGQPAAVEGEQKQQQLPENLSKKNCGGEQGNDALEFESLSREDLVNLVRQQLLEKNEAQKQLETTRKEAEESARKQAQEFSQRNIQLEQEKAEVDAELGKKLAEIVELHKEVEQKSGELTEKAKQINSLLIQLNESTRQEEHQSGLPTDEQQMKIQLSLETWYDWLTFVPRHQLGQIVPRIGDRKFASIVQKFLHKYGEIMIDSIEIVAPYEEDPSGPEQDETQMPANIKNFKMIELSYFDPSVLNFMQKFQQNGLLDNVNLFFPNLSAKDIVQPVLCHLLPLVNGIVSIYMDSAQLVHFYDAGNSEDIYELNMKMMETKILGVSCDPQNLDANKIDLYCRWLYQPARADGKPRMLVIVRENVDYSPISLFIDQLKKDFLLASNPVSFFIRIILPKAIQIQSQEDICLDNGKTKERFQTQMEKVDTDCDKIVLLISRVPLGFNEKWVAEISEKAINLIYGLEVVAI